MRRFVVTGLSAVLGLAAAGHAEESVWSKRRPNRDAPPTAVAPGAGEYSCFLLAMGGSVVTPYGAAPTMTPMPSGIDRLTLDGKREYRHASGSGRYHYEAHSGRIVFESGPLQGWSTRSETDGAKRWLRFAAKKGAELAPKSSLGDHICSLRSVD